VKFDEQYIKTLERVFDLTKDGRTEEIETDFSIPKMFGAWSSIFWALPHLDKFGGLEFDELKRLVKALVKSHVSYKSTTNQYLRTETLNWIIGTLRIKANVYGIDSNEGLYAESWANQLFTNPETPYQYDPNIGRQLLADRETKNEINKKLEDEKQARLQKEEKENELRQAEKQKTYFEHLDRNQKQKELRENFLNEFSKLGLVDKLIAITTDTKPLHYYPTDFADVDIETLKSLSFEQRTRLFEMIKKYRVKEWYDTKERIQQLDRK
jgi:flagellar biosynthesis GTPase FlhF